MTRIVMLSDTHNLHDSVIVPDGDILIHAGDATNDGTREEEENFIKWFRALPHRSKIIVGGNHDDILETNPEIAQGEGIEYLCDREVTIDGLRFYGSPYRTVPAERMLNKHLNWSAFMVDELWASHIWNDIPEGLDMLITHQPPYQVLDYAPPVHWGSPALLDAVTRAKPRYHVFGHVHDQNGRLYYRDMNFINATICSNVPGIITGKPIVLDV